MSFTAALPATAARRAVLADLLPGRLARDVALVLGGAALTGLLAQIAVPVAGSPVPVTGQTFGALVVGAALGWRRAAASMTIYLLAGLAGVPWYSDGRSGILPSFGYIIGFVVAAALVGALAARGADRRPLPTVGVMILGNVVIYTFGLAWLAADLGLSATQAYEIGMKNYLVGDAAKILLAAGLLPAAWRLTGHRPSDR